MTPIRANMPPPILLQPPDQFTNFEWHYLHSAERDKFLSYLRKATVFRSYSDSWLLSPDFFFLNSSNLAAILCSSPRSVGS
jgi:hypothetical protein